MSVRRGRYLGFRAFAVLGTLLALLSGIGGLLVTQRERHSASQVRTLSCGKDVLVVLHKENESDEVSCAITWRDRRIVTHVQPLFSIGGSMTLSDFFCVTSIDGTLIALLAIDPILTHAPKAGSSESWTTHVVRHSVVAVFDGSSGAYLERQASDIGTRNQGWPNSLLDRFVSDRPQWQRDRPNAYLSHVRHLEIYGDVAENLRDSLCHFTRVDRLGLGIQHIDRSYVDAIAQMPRLRILSIADASIDEGTLIYLISKTNLQELVISRDLLGEQSLDVFCRRVGARREMIRIRGYD